MKRLACLLYALAAMSPSLPAATISYVADLNGANESPAAASPGVGTAWVTVDNVSHTMRVRVVFSGLLALNTASHIHCCTSVPGTGTAGVATMTPTFLGFPTGATEGAYDRTFDTTDFQTYRASFLAANGGTAAGAEAALFAGLANGTSYLNIHTSIYPGGEIRGFLQEVPEPATYALAGVALLALAIRRRL
ncbi:MAG TPA: CHRD domain-containing protein [Paludibaculum sp.]|jgi:hypothetical protein